MSYQEWVVERCGGKDPLSGRDDVMAAAAVTEEVDRNGRAKPCVNL